MLNARNPQNLMSQNKCSRNPWTKFFDVLWLLGGQCAGDPALADEIRSYARDQVGKLGKHLELGDAFLCAELQGKSLGFIWDNEARKLEISSAVAYVRSAIPEMVTSGSEDLNLSSPDTWLLLTCAANWDPKSNIRNHWVPCFTQHQLGDERFWALTSLAEATARKEFVEINNKIAEWELRDPEDEDSDEQDLEMAAVIAGLKDQCEMQLGYAGFGMSFGMFWMGLDFIQCYKSDILNYLNIFYI